MHDIYRQISSLNNNPKQETLFNLLTSRLFDGFKFISIHFFVVLTNIFMFIALNSLNGHQPGTFQYPRNESMVFFGAKDADKILWQQEIWRLWTPVFLHFSPINLIVDSFLILQFAPKMEKVFGVWRMLALQILLPPLSIIFSITLDMDSVMQVSQVQPAGFMAAKIGWHISNIDHCCASTWNAFFEIFIFTCLSLITGIISTPTDLTALSGAIIQGFVLGACILGDDGRIRSKVLMSIAATLVVLLFTSCSQQTIIYRDQVKEYQYDHTQKLLEEYFTKSKAYSNKIKDFTAHHLQFLRDQRLIMKYADIEVIKDVQKHQTHLPHSKKEIEELSEHPQAKQEIDESNMTVKNNNKNTSTDLTKKSENYQKKYVLGANYDNDQNYKYKHRMKNVKFKSFKFKKR